MLWCFEEFEWGEGEVGVGLFEEFEFEAGETVAEVGEQLQMTSSEGPETEVEVSRLFPLTTVTSPEASPLATACSHLTALFFREGELTSPLDLLGLR